MRIQVWRRFATVLVVASVLFALGSAFLWHRVASTRPAVADSSAGRVHALNTHGAVVFLTKGERARLYAIEGTAVSCFIVAV